MVLYTHTIDKNNFKIDIISSFWLFLFTYRDIIAFIVIFMQTGKIDIIAKINNINNLPDDIYFQLVT